MLKITDIDKYEKIEESPIKNTELYDHQKLLISACMTYELNQAKDGIITNFGFINDMTGAGKTICAISMITLLNQKKDKKRLKYDILPNTVGQIKSYVPKAKDYKSVLRNKKSLIIVPLGLAPQWDKELKRFSKLDYVYLASIKDIRKFNIKKSKKKVILCKSSMLKKFFDHSDDNKDYHYARVFIDECDSIDISFFPYITSDFYWFVSATCEKDGIIKCKNLGFIRDTYDNILNFRKDDFRYELCNECQIKVKALNDHKLSQWKKVTEDKSYHCEMCFHVESMKYWGRKYSQILQRYHPDCYRYGYRYFNYQTRTYKYDSVGLFAQLLNKYPVAALPEKGCEIDMEDLVANSECAYCQDNNNRLHYNHIKKIYTFKNDPAFVNECTKLSVPIENYHDCYTPHFISVTNRSQNVIDQDTIRMINSGDFQGAAESYGIDMKSGENIIVLIKRDIEKKIEGCQLKIKKDEKLQSDLKEQIEVLKVAYEEDSPTEEQKEELDNMKKRVTNAKNRIKTQKNRIKNLTGRLNSLVKTIREVNKETCAICIDQMEAPCMVKCCNMMYCLPCITEWMIGFDNKTCPNCRADLNKDMLVNIQNEKRDQKGLLSKEETLKKLFKDVFTKEDKILIFTEQDNTIEKITLILDELNIKYLAYKKTSTGFTNIVGYTDSDVQVAVLNSVSHGAGLNLQMTTDIVLFHKMSPELETQAIGRGQRPGRTKPLKVHRLCYDNEYTGHMPHAFVQSGALKEETVKMDNGEEITVLPKKKRKIRAI